MIVSRAVTKSDSGFMDLNQIPVFQGLRIDSDQFFGILEMIHRGFTWIFFEIFEVLLNFKKIL